MRPAMTPPRFRRRRSSLVMFGAAAAVLLALNPASAAASVRARPHHSALEVAYAGSLVSLMEEHLGPAFDHATGDHFIGYGAGSQELANEIVARTRQVDVFISASARVDSRLEGRDHGNYVTWDAAFATAPLVLGYNPRSRFAAQLRHRPWYRVISEPGFQLGRTDPALDPKGALSVEALRQIARREHDPAVLRLLRDNADVFPEQTLMGRLEAGQLDAGLFYLNETKAASIPTRSLAPVHLATTFTVTVLAHAEHPTAASAFVRFLLSSEGRRLERSAGLIPIPPRVAGTGIPAGLRAVLRR